MSNMGKEHVGEAIRQSFLGVDTGDIRVGIAVKLEASTKAQPVCVLENDESVFRQIIDIAKRNKAETIIVGLPRDINGNETTQTRKARYFAGELADLSGLHVILHDEFATSERARVRLGKLSREEEKSQLDAMSATVLLEDYMKSMVD